MGFERPSTAAATKSHAISSSAVPIAADGWGFTAPVLAAAKRAYITARTAGVMVTWSGTTPTAALGHLVPQNGTLQLDQNANILALQLIREGSTDAVVSITLEV